MARANTWVTDLRHFIDEATDDWADMPAPALNLAIPLGAIVACVTDHLPDGDDFTNVPCWRSPNRRRCHGEIIAELENGSSQIVWHCPFCGQNGVIHGWEGTLWDRRFGVETARSVRQLRTTDLINRRRSVLRGRPIDFRRVEGWPRTLTADD